MRVVSCTQNLAKESALVLNPAKCEVLITSSTKPASQSPVCILGDQPLFPQDCVKCPGYWWSWDFSATKGVDEAIKKARKSFFSYVAMGAFQGKLNPISGKAIYETCAVPSYCMDVRIGF